MITCAIYPRKSKANDNSQSMEQQISDCRRYIEEHFPSAKICIYDKDYALTGHSTKKRKDFLRMMDDVRAGRIQTVVIMRYDRIARNMRDFCNLYHDMEDAGCNLVSVSQQIDTSTPYGKNFMYQMAAMAELEWAIISERYKDSARYKREHGFAYTGRVPYGYMIKMCEDGHKRVVKDPDHDAMVVFNYYRECRNKHQTIRYMKSIGYEKFNYDILRTMFDADMYCGKVKGNDHFCEPYMTESDLEELRSLKVVKNTPSGNVYIFSQLLKCPLCGNNMSATKGGTNGNFLYYRCGYHNHEKIHETIGISESKIEKLLIEKLDMILHEQIIKASAESSKSNDSKIAELESEQNRLNYLFEKGRISLESYEQKFDHLTEQIAELKQEAKEIDYQAVQNTFCDGWKEIYKKLTKENKKTFLHSTIKEIRISSDKNIENIIFM